MSHADEGTLHAYLDGELPPAERGALEAHLAQCATCRASLAEERALLERASALLGAARPVERPAPPLEQLRRQPQRSPWRVRTSVAWAASIALALGVGYYLRSPNGSAIEELVGNTLSRQRPESVMRFAQNESSNSQLEGKPCGRLAGAFPWPAEQTLHGTCGSLRRSGLPWRMRGKTVGVRRLQPPVQRSECCSFCLSRSTQPLRTRSAAPETIRSGWD